MLQQDKIFQFFSTKFPFNKEGLEEFIKSFEKKTFKKGEIILTQGKVEKELRFLDSGTIREFFAHEGKEMNTSFYVNSSFISDFSSLTTGNMTKRNQECLTSVSLRVLSKT